MAVMCAVIINSSLGPVVQKMDSAIHWINHYSLDNANANSNTGTYPLDLVPIYPG